MTMLLSGNSLHFKVYDIFSSSAHPLLLLPFVLKDNTKFQFPAPGFLETIVNGESSHRDPWY